MKKSKLAIIGSGDLGQLIAHHAQSTNKFEVVGFFDDFKTKGDITLNNKPILGNTKLDILSLYRQKKIDCLFIGIGYKHMSFREDMFNQYFGLIPFANIIHESCYIDKNTTLGEGNILLPRCTLDSGVVLENNILLNTGVTIAHDSIIKSHCFLGPSVSLAGFIEIDQKCFLGIGTIIIDNIKICQNVQTGGGTVITKSINNAGLYVGIPARKIK